MINIVHAAREEVPGAHIFKRGYRAATIFASVRAVEPFDICAEDVTRYDSLRNILYLIISASNILCSDYMLSVYCKRRTNLGT